MKAVLGFLLLFCIECVQAQKMFGPVHGYVSVETFEIRKEFVMRLDTMAERLGLDLQKDGGVISAERRIQIELDIGEWLMRKCPLDVDGRRVEMELDRVHFVRTDPQLGMVVEDRETFAADEALLGVVFAAALDGPAKKVKIRWEVFPANGAAAIVAIGTRENTVTRKVSSEAPELYWESKGELKIPELLGLPSPPQVDFLEIPLLSVVLLFVVLVFVCVAIRLRKKTPAWFGPVMIAVATIAMVAREKMMVNIFSEPVEISAELADEVVYALLRNTYRAFDYRKESDVYDVLSESVGGDLLTKVYLDVQDSLELESQGGARARVYELDLRNCELNETKGEGGIEFSAKCSWVAIGTVTHWGHTHDRVNRYEAQLSVAVVNGAWKLKALDLLNEERMETGLRPGRKTSLTSPGAEIKEKSAQAK